MNKLKTRGWLGHSSIIKSLEQKFGESNEGKIVFDTLDTKINSKKTRES